MPKRRTVAFDDLHAFLGLAADETIEYVTSYLGATHIVVHTTGAPTPIELTQQEPGAYRVTRAVTDEPPHLH